MRVLLVLLALSAYLAGCGYKAPLYMPKPQAQIAKPRMIVTPEPDAGRPVPAEATPRPK
jgi:predicted small lipoprotein YifL